MVTMERELTAQLMTQVEFVDAPGMKGKKLQVGALDAEAPIVGATAEVLDANGKPLPGTAYVRVYDTETREPSVLPYMMLERQLNILREDGSRVFTTVRPKEPPIRGSFLCPLHPKAPRRDEFDKVGLPKCRKANLMTEMDVQRHFKSCHPRAWQYSEQARVRDEKENDRDFQRRMMEMMVNATAARTASAPTPAAVSVASIGCPDCPRTFGNKQGLAAHRRHMHSRKTE